MKRERSWAYFEYRRAFRLMRRGFSYKKLWDGGEHCLSVLKAADYSYQAAYHELHGWSNDIRRKRFYQIFWRVMTARGELPF